MTLTFDLAMTLTLDFQGQIFKLLYPRKGLSAWQEMKGIWIDMLWTHYMTLTFDPTHDFDLGFLRSNLEIAVFQEWMGPDLFGAFAETY